MWEAAKIMGFSVRTLRQWKKDGKIKCTQPSGQRGVILISEDEIERCLRGEIYEEK